MYLKKLMTITIKIRREYISIPYILIQPISNFTPMLE
jgi:hypothetical protein